jgi:hydroxyethylthiazole kinase
MIEQISTAQKLLVKAKPLVLNLTNYVTQDFMANSLLAIGAAPMMIEGDDELEELINISSSVNINIGTLNDAFIKRCHKALDLAQQYKKPIVLDPVGAGASIIRTKTSQDFMKRVDIVRGNASEIIALQGEGKTIGVEATNSTDEAKAIAIELCKKYGVTIVVSGPVDFITDGERRAEICFGSPLMSKVTGMGCSLTAVIAAFRGVITDSFEAAIVSTGYFGLCGELAAKKTRSPGSFRTGFVDALYEAEFAKAGKCHAE